MAPPLLFLRDIHLTFGGEPLLDGADLTVGENDRLCLVGRNGSGKSTLLKIAAGALEADTGERFVQPGVTVRYLPQEPDFSGFSSARAYVEAGLAPGDDPHRAQILLEELGLDGDADPARLSGGESRRAALARTLAPEPDILLLDEPTNHLDLPAIEWLESSLKGLRSALVLISHDRRFLETLSRRVTWLDLGKTQHLDQGFAAFEDWRDTYFEQLELEKHKLDRRIAAEIEWLHYGGVTARRRRNQGRLRALNAMRQQRRDARAPTGQVKMTVTEGETSGKLVAETKGVSKSFDGRKILNDISLRVLRGDRLGIVGPNGSGKTTLLNILTGAAEPDDGTVRLGTSLQLVSLDQRRESLEPNWTLSEALTGGKGDRLDVGGQTKHVIGYMKEFLFTPEQARQPVHALSGGERGRLMLARALARPSNVLILDEPTNDLDLETLDLLQDMIADYTGTVLLVSHDRDFIDRIVTSVIAAEGDGRWIEYAGGYSDMLAQRGPVAGQPSAPSRRPSDAPKQTKAKSPANAAAQSSPAAKRKLSFKEKHAHETLPAKIDALQAEVDRLQKVLHDPTLYARDAEAYATTASALARAQETLAEAEDQWLALEMLIEEIEAR